MKKSKLFFMAFLMTLDLAFVAASFSYSPDARMIPLIVGTAGFIMIFPIFVNEVHPLRFMETMNFSMVDELVQKGGRKPGSESRSGTKLIVIIGWLSGFFILVFLVGFPVGIFVFTLMYLKFEAGVTWPKAILGSGFFWMVIFLVFEVAMNFTLFRGLLFGEIVPAL